MTAFYDVGTLGYAQTLQDALRNSPQQNAGVNAQVHAQHQIASLQSLYGYANSYPRQTYKPFPRSKAQKEQRMTKFVEWKREQIAQRRWRRFWLVSGIMFGAPIMLAGLAWCWRAAIASIVL